MMPKFKGKTKPKLHKPSMETVMRWMIRFFSALLCCCRYLQA